ncbi:MAG: hypothetical protein A3I44_01865 [Candidatus Sungbacteria bacterium RIFCSPLOWO2_02_FULL_51_17]|nr:MAG: hypothetical protein A3B29_03225 [Candidatus Sungbacteria bacterium RIFCSPLOWO2_01_FULL_51_34]OHA11409.1 MAG: hypothetical protein A3I44_01865 [Candidatus Sungbacteria bacterium RIFCSPLOWO2_02_FULL_51_17]
MQKTVIVIPTYNERDNLRPLIEGVFSLGLPNIQVVVVDDNSPDGTRALAEELAKTYPLLIIHRKVKTGIGAAYVEAFQTILNDPQKPDYIIQMDADLSHDPRTIPAMLAHAEKYDVVLGSRYITGGAIVNWDLTRRLISRFGNFYARTVLWLPYRDLTGGFKCFRREVLEHIDLASVSSVGYCFQIETTLKAHRKNYRITEIPISFTERRVGASKFKASIMLESFMKVFFMRFHE